MKKNYTATLVLTGVFVVLTAWYLGYEKKWKPKQTEAEEKSKALVTLASDDIHEIDIQRMKNPPDEVPEPGKPAVPPPAPGAAPEFETIKLKKTGQDWNIVSPIQDTADNSAAGAMASTLVTTHYDRVVDEKPKDLEPYGLKVPIVKIVVRKDSSGPGQEVYLGKNTPVGFSVYAKMQGSDAVYRASRTLRTTFDKDVKSLRNKSILNLSRPEVGEVEVQSGKNHYVMKKDDKDTWILASENIPADQNEWNKTINPLVELKAIEFVAENADDLAEYGLDKPAAQAWLTRSKDKTKLGLWFGFANKKLYVKREDRPVIYEVDKSILEKLMKPGSDFRSLQLANFNRFDIKRVKLERGKEILEFLKENNAWTMPTEPKTKIDSAKIDTLLTRLQDTKIMKYLPAAQAADIDEPLLTVRLYEKKDKDTPENERVAVKFGKAPRGNDLLGERTGLEVGFTVKADDFQKLNLSRQSFLQPEKPQGGKDENKKEPEKKSS